MHNEKKRAAFLWIPLFFTSKKDFNQVAEILKERSNQNNIKQSDFKDKIN